jgi:hypothetical protein
MEKIASPVAVIVESGEGVPEVEGVPEGEGVPEVEGAPEVVDVEVCPVSAGAASPGLVDPLEQAPRTSASAIDDPVTAARARGGTGGMAPPELGASILLHPTPDRGVASPAS